MPSVWRTTGAPRWDHQPHLPRRRCSVVDCGRLFDAAVGRLVLMYRASRPCLSSSRNVRPGGIVAFQEWVAATSPASTMNQRVLAACQDLIWATFERSGAQLKIGPGSTDACVRQPRAGRPLAEIAVCMRGAVVSSWASSDGCSRRWSIRHRRGEEIRDAFDRRLRDELIDTLDLVPLSSVLIGQWARKPHAELAAFSGPSGETWDRAYTSRISRSLR
jgi:hypothetical protein